MTDHPLTLAGKVVVVTGANSGIGAAIVEACGKYGADVVIDYVAHPEANAAIVADVVAEGGKAVPVDADITTAAGLQALRDAAVQKYGRLDVWVNNAGIETRHALLDTTEDDFDAVLKVDLWSAFFGAQAAARQLPIARGTGRSG